MNSTQRENPEKLASSTIPTEYGKFNIVAYDSGIDQFPHVVLAKIPLPLPEIANVRIHSECMTGDVFGSLRCDCGEQLHQSMRYFGEHGGVLVYLRQEGRGIGLVNKLKAYNLQDEKNLDTIKANHALGFHTDERDYAPGVAILREMGIRKIRLFTNNPEKIDAFEGSGIEVVERVPIEVSVRAENAAYISVKRDILGHLF